MQFLTLLFIASTASAQAIIQLLATLPACSIDCLTAGLKTYNCAIRDVVCSCGYKDEITVDVTPCVTRSCSVADGNSVRNITDQVCALAETMFSSSYAAFTATATRPASRSSTLLTKTSSSSSSPITTTSSSSPTSSSSSSTAAPTGPPMLKSNSKLSAGAKAGIGAGVAIFGILLIGAIALCVMGWRRRGKDLKHLAWIERRGTVKGRTELEVREVGKSSVDATGGQSGGGVPGAAVGGVQTGSSRPGTAVDGVSRPGTTIGESETVGSEPGGDALRVARSREDIVSPVSPMESSFGHHISEPAAGERGDGRI